MKRKLVLGLLTVMMMVSMSACGQAVKDTGNSTQVVSESSGEVSEHDVLTEDGAVILGTMSNHDDYFTSMGVADASDKKVEPDLAKVSSINTYVQSIGDYYHLDVQKYYNQELSLDDICNLFSELSQYGSLTFYCAYEDQSFYNISAEDLKVLLQDTDEWSSSGGKSTRIYFHPDWDEDADIVDFDISEHKQDMFDENPTYEYTLKLFTEAWDTQVDGQYVTTIDYADGTKVALDDGYWFCGVVLTEGTLDSLE